MGRPWRRVAPQKAQHHMPTLLHWQRAAELPAAGHLCFHVTAPEGARNLQARVECRSNGWQQCAHSICVSSTCLPVDYPPTLHTLTAIPSAQSRYVRTMHTHG